MFSRELKISDENNELLNKKIVELQEKNLEYDLKLSESIDQQKYLLDKYSDEIKLAVKQRVLDEVYSTNLKGNLVRYSEETNQLFPIKTTKKVLVTATMSAGKSTVINALIGKELLKARNEATTGKVYHVLNSMIDTKDSNRFEDVLIRGLNDDETEQQVESNSMEDIYLGTSFNSELLKGIPLEIIDTPGINYAGDVMHKEITDKCLKELDYDLILYVINATQNGVTDDRAHLREIQEIDKPVIFIFNKVDEYNAKKDSIEDNIKLTTNFLQDVGFINPEVIPISAYAGLLAKKVINHIELNEFEEEDLASLTRKFNHYNPFNLDQVQLNKDRIDEANMLLVNSGIVRLEKKITEV